MAVRGEGRAVQTAEARASAAPVGHYPVAGDVYGVEVLGDLDANEVSVVAQDAERAPVHPGEVATAAAQGEVGGGTGVGKAQGAAAGVEHPQAQVGAGGDVLAPPHHMRHRRTVALELAQHLAPEGVDDAQAATAYGELAPAGGEGQRAQPPGGQDALDLAPTPQGDPARVARGHPLVADRQGRAGPVHYLQRGAGEIGDPAAPGAEQDHVIANAREVGGPAQNPTSRARTRPLLDYRPDGEQHAVLGPEAHVADATGGSEGGRAAAQQRARG